MNELKHIIFEGKTVKNGVVEVIVMDDGSALLFDTFLDFSKELGIDMGYEYPSEENLIGCFSNFEEVRRFVRMIVGDIICVL